MAPMSFWSSDTKRARGTFEVRVALGEQTHSLVIERIVFSDFFQVS